MNGLASKDVATVGITFCTKELGDIVYVEVETLDQTLEKMRFWYGRGSKNSFRFILPMAGEIIALMKI
jgi:glycine cleavage system H protein